MSNILPLFGVFSLFLLWGCQLDQEARLTAEEFILSLEEQGIKANPISLESLPELENSLPGQIPYGLFQSDLTKFAIYEFETPRDDENGEGNGSVSIYANLNLLLAIDRNADPAVVLTFESMRPSLGYRQVGVFIYPLGLCLLVAAFVIAERCYALRRGLTFPRKVEKALRTGEFPDKRWKKRSAAERIVFVATHEEPSDDSLKSYARLEVAALEQGLFLLEVVVAGAPLVGLLGTVTGLVQVFSAMPASGGTAGGGIFSEGIALALLTTIMGLAIAIPALIGHAYLMRVIEKRTASLDWLTARLIDAVKPKSRKGQGM